MEAAAQPGPPNEKGPLARAQTESKTASFLQNGPELSSLPRAKTASELARTAADWAAWADRFTEDVLRHDVPPAGFRVLLAIVKASYALCRTTAVYSELRELALAAGVDSSNIRKVLDELGEGGRQVLIEKRFTDRWEFTLQPEPKLWRHSNELSTREEYEANRLQVLAFIYNRDRSRWLIEPPQDSILEAQADLPLSGAPPPSTRNLNDSASSHLPDAGGATRSIYESGSRAPAQPESATRSNYESSPSLKALSVQEASKLKGLSGAPNGGGRRAGEEEYMARVLAVLGNDIYENDGGKWRVRFRQNPGKCMRVLLEVERMIREGEPIRKPGANMEYIWQQFA